MEEVLNRWPREVCNARRGRATSDGDAGPELEGFVPQDHPLRRNEPMVGSVLARISPSFDELYTAAGVTAKPNSLASTSSARRTSRPPTLGADRCYDTRDFVADVQALGVTPHVAQNERGQRRAIDGRTTRRLGYCRSHRRRKLVEEVSVDQDGRGTSCAISAGPSTNSGSNRPPTTSTAWPTSRRRPRSRTEQGQPPTPTSRPGSRLATYRTNSASGLSTQSAFERLPFPLHLSLVQQPASAHAALPPATDSTLCRSCRRRFS